MNSPTTNTDTHVSSVPLNSLLKKLRAYGIELGVEETAAIVAIDAYLQEREEAFIAKLLTRLPVNHVVPHKQYVTYTT